MPRKPQGPQCPSIKQIESAMDWVQTFDNDEANNANQCLDWLLTFLDNRRIYHKKHQLQNKYVRQLLKEKLGEEMQDVKTAAAKLADNEVFNSIANEEPDSDVKAMAQNAD